MGVQEPVEDKSGEESCEMAEREAQLKFRANEGKHRGSEWKHRKMFKEGRNEAADVGGEKQQQRAHRPLTPQAPPLPLTETGSFDSGAVGQQTAHVV